MAKRVRPVRRRGVGHRSDQAPTNPEQGSHRTADLHAVSTPGSCAISGSSSTAADGGATSYARLDDWLFIHGSVASRTLRAARTPVQACVTVTMSTDWYWPVRCSNTPSTTGAPWSTDSESSPIRRKNWSGCAPSAIRWRRPVEYARLRRPRSCRYHRLEDGARRVVGQVRTGPPDDGEGPDADLDVWPGDPAAHRPDGSGGGCRAPIRHHGPEHLAHGRAGPGPFRGAGSESPDRSTGHRREAPRTAGSVEHVDERTG